MTRISRRTVERFFLYSKFLHARMDMGAEYVFSRELASAVGVSPEQVRRDLMNFSLTGTPQKGYPIKEFTAELYQHLEAASLTKIVLVGVGNFGKAILTYFIRRRPNLSIVAAFDTDPDKTDRVYSGCQIYHTDMLPRIAAEQGAAVGVITVPAAAAQQTADALVRAGVRGIINFAPVQIRVPDDVFLEQLDITLSIEKAAYFAKKTVKEQTT